MDRFTRAAHELGFTRQLTQRVTRLATVTALGLSLVGNAHATSLGHVSVNLSNPAPSATNVSYTFTGGDGAAPVTASNVKCVMVVVASSSTGDTAPTGFDGTGAAVDATNSTLINSLATGWSLATSDGTSSTGQDNIFKYTNSTGVTPSTTSGATFILTGLTNGSANNVPYYFLVSTYGNTNCTSSPVDVAGPQYVYTPNSQLSLTVDPTLSFTINAVGASAGCNGTTTTQASTATTIPFGTVTASSNAVVCQDLIAATNATNGYTIYTRYTSKPTNGLSQTIADHSGSNTTPTTFSAAGTEAYGYSTNDATLGTGTANRFTNGGQKWAAETTTNEEIAYEAAGVAATTYRIGHQVGISLTTNAGNYTTTILYTCTPIY